MSQYITQLADNDPSLTSLDLSNGQLQEQQIEELSKALINNTHIKQVNLSSNNLNDTHIKTISEALVTCPNLESVNFTRNRLSTLAGRYVFQIFGPTRNRIVRLNLKKIF